MNVMSGTARVFLLSTAESPKARPARGAICMPVANCMISADSQPDIKNT